MKSGKASQLARLEDLDDAALVAQADRRDGAAFWLIIKRHNQPLYRVARAVLDDDAEAKDVVQETYIRAFMHLSGIRGGAALDVAHPHRAERSIGSPPASSIHGRREGHWTHGRPVQRS